MTTDTLFSVKRITLRWPQTFMLGGLSFALTLFCLELIKVSGQISPLWFSTALMTMVIFRLPLTSLPLALLSCFIGVALANSLVIGPGIANVKYPLINLTQAIIGGSLLRVMLDRQSPLGSLMSWSKMMVTVGMFTPLVGGLGAQQLRSQQLPLLLHLGGVGNDWHAGIGPGLPAVE